MPLVVGAFSKLFLRAGCREVRVDGLPTFLERLKGERGVLTGAFRRARRCASVADPRARAVSNHISVCVVLPLNLLISWARQAHLRLSGETASTSRSCGVACLCGTFSTSARCDGRSARATSCSTSVCPRPARGGGEGLTLREIGPQGKWDRWFFTKGQVIETFRGKGIYQKAIDEATKKLDEGQWVRLAFRLSLLRR